ncbi:MAG: hypothetical protein ACKOYN_03430, partial [Planctomycetota bacterium]
RQGEPGALEVVLADDRAFRDPGFLARSGAVAEVVRMDFRGEIRARIELPLLAHAECGLPAATARGRIPERFLDGCRKCEEVLVAKIVGEPSLARAVEFLAPDAELRLPRAEFAEEIGGARTWRATGVVREFWIEQDWPSVPADDARALAETDSEAMALELASRALSWRTLLPGDEIVLPAGSAPIWWCANAFAR